MVCSDNNGVSGLVEETMLDGMSLHGGDWANGRIARRICASIVMALAFCLVVVAQDSPQVADPAQQTKPDRIGVLRAQIREAKDATERARLQRTLVDYLVALNRKSEAIAELRAMVRESRVDAVGLYNLGNALARLGEGDAAIDAYRKAIDQRKGKYPHALNNLGVVLIRQSRWDEALEALQAALKQENMRYGEASYNLGRLYWARNETKQAIDAWTRALALQPDHLDAALALARALAADGNPERGIAVIDAFVARQGPNKSLIDARNEILTRKAGREIKSHGPTPEEVEAQTKP
ncbi:MAG TPA: tetratricopeptide repeat protein [Pyrinomonadaceae bacterium]